MNKNENINLHDSAVSQNVEQIEVNEERRIKINKIKKEFNAMQIDLYYFNDVIRDIEDIDKELYEEMFQLYDRIDSAYEEICNFAEKIDYLGERVDEESDLN